MQTPRLARKPGAFVDVELLQLQQQQSNSAPPRAPPPTEFDMFESLILSVVPDDEDSERFGGQHLGGAR